MNKRPEKRRDYFIWKLKKCMHFPEGLYLKKNHTAINVDQFERYVTHEQHNASAS